MWYVNMLPVASLRKEPSEKSELVSQLLFGEAYQILDRLSDWMLVKCHFDNYEGWMSQAQLSTHELNPADASSDWLVAEPVMQVKNNDGNQILLPMGSCVAPSICDISADTFEEWQKSGRIVSAGDPSPDKLIRFAAQLLGSPYLWGGRNPLGYDCSGFVQVVCKLAGLKLPRDARDQALVGEIIDFQDQAQAGDLAFFDNESGNIIHVGLLDGKGGIVHCSGKVRHDSLDAYGIFNRETKKHTHKLRLIRRLL
ncbi:MAG: C40 family peptidase [Bacteroidetes bacterium]|nr:C40 family peptidase [Bacteroidota bacterium]